MFSKLKNQLPPTGLLAAGLTVITLLTALSGLWNYNHDLASQPAIKLTGASRQAPIAGAAAKNLGLTAVNGSSGASTTVSSGKSSPTATSGTRTTTKSAASSGSTAAAANSPASQPAGAVAPPPDISVALSVNGSGKGQVQLAAGSNQCNVLTQALASGVISSLDMRYNSQYNSEAVYVIDGIGDPGTVWWTYTVNGTPPPYGCSAMPARNGDSINWQYVH